MNVHGYCTRCHRIKLIRLTGAVAATLGMGRGAPMGVCVDCEDEQAKR